MISVDIRIHGQTFPFLCHATVLPFVEARLRRKFGRDAVVITDCERSANQELALRGITQEREGGAFFRYLRCGRVVYRGNVYSVTPWLARRDRKVLAMMLQRFEARLRNASLSGAFRREVANG